MKPNGTARRPLKTRERPWARALARWLAARGVRPNAVSLASVLFAALSGTFFYLYLSLEESADTSGEALSMSRAGGPIGRGGPPSIGCSKSRIASPDRLPATISPRPSGSQKPAP